MPLADIHILLFHWKKLWILQACNRSIINSIHLYQGLDSSNTELF